MLTESATGPCAGSQFALTTSDAPAEMHMFGVYLEAVAEDDTGPQDSLP